MLCVHHRLDPAVQDLQRYIEDDAGLVQLFERAFDEIPNEFLQASGQSGRLPVRNHTSLMQAINQAIITAPQWTSVTETQCVIACPINEAMIWFMNTRTGSQILSRADINAYLLAILQRWSRYLSSPDSAEAIHNKPGGWVSARALTELLDVVNNAHTSIPFQASRFEDAFVCDPSRPNYGFRSWDDFFTRRFRPRARPVAAPGDARVVVNPCESQPFALMWDVPAKAHFSLKGHVYSLQDMLDGDPHAARFTGGTVFQAWLSAFSYHRWHAPVTGTVVKVLRIPGTFFAVDPAKGFENIDPATGRPCPDRQAPDASLKAISSVATRTAVLIRADKEDLGTVGFLAIGMAEVSSCVSTVAVGDRVSKGQEIGSFHYGGSSFCLLFEPGVQLRFSPPVEDSLAHKPGITGRCIAVNSKLAEVVERGL